MVRRRVRAMLPRSVLMPVSISRAVFGHRNTSSPMALLHWRPSPILAWPGRGEAPTRARGLWTTWISSQKIVAPERRLWVGGRIARGRIPGKCPLAGLHRRRTRTGEHHDRAPRGRDERHPPARGGNGERPGGRVLPRLAGDFLLLAP